MRVVLLVFCAFGLLLSAKDAQYRLTTSSTHPLDSAGYGNLASLSRDFVPNTLPNILNGTPMSRQEHLIDDEGDISESFVFNPDNLLVPKSVDFVERLSTELYQKTGFVLKIALVLDTNATLQKLQTQFFGDFPPSANYQDDAPKDSQARKNLTNLLSLSLQEPYALFLFFADEKKIDIIQNPKLFNDESLYFEYMAPLLPQKGEELDSKRISAIMLNGYSEAADLIASHYDVKLEFNMPRDESGSRDFVRVSMYVMLLILLGTLGFVYITSRFRSK